MALLNFTAIAFSIAATAIIPFSFANEEETEGSLRGTTIPNTDCPFTPPQVGFKGLTTHGTDLTEWGGWLYDLDSIKRFHIMESAHEGIYDFLGPGKSLVDVGAGVGQMKVALDRINADIDYFGLDGGANIMELEGTNTPVRGDENHIVPHVCWADASKPFSLDRQFDAVMSKEVGEHIPPEGESAFMDNLVKLAKPNGGWIILTWAHVGQGGHHHVNCKDQPYVIEKMEERGVIYDILATEDIGSKIASAYAENLMVFYKP